MLYGTLNGIFEIMFMLIFFMIIAAFIAVAFRGFGEWNRNNQSPRLTTDATVTAKRTKVSVHQEANAGDITGAHGYHTLNSTTYYVTFRVESGDRMEFCVPGKEYGMLAEGDTGKLMFQGTRYLGFERE